MVTLGIGARLRITQWIDIGAVYEFALTGKSEEMLDDRYLVDLIISVPL